MFTKRTKTDVAAHRHLGCRGANRADFRGYDRVEGTGELVCLDVNTEPGMTEISPCLSLRPLRAYRSVS
jgi:D-alanine-D-alanine ligase-like ATP-grasp enzyme